MTNNKLGNTIGLTWDEYGNPIPLTGETNNTPATINIRVLRQCITMYIDDLESYGTDDEVNEYTVVLWDFVKYVEAMGAAVTKPKPILTGLSKMLWGDGDTCSVTFYPKDDEQSIIDYNAMEEEWEMDNYNKIKDEQ
jgi:hypothetical protein